MQQFFAAFMHRSQAYQRGPKLETDIQLGDEVSVWIGAQSEPNGQPKLLPLPGVLVGVKIMPDACAFDVAFQIGDTEIFGVLREVLSHITRRGEPYNPLGLPEGANEAAGGDGQPPKPAEEPKRPGLRLAVHNKDSQLAADEAAAQEPAAAPALSVVGSITDLNKTFSSAPAESAVEGLARSIEQKQVQLRNELLAFGLAGKRTLQFPREFWVEMVSRMPEEAQIVEENETTFQIEYPSVESADAELQLFFAQHPLHCHDVQVVRLV